MRTIQAAPFRLIVADNFHYMDEDDSYEQGTYPTLEAAIAVAKRMVDQYLARDYKPGMSAQELYEQYRSFGEDPFIRHAGLTDLPFSAWRYAKQRCAELCTPTQLSLPFEPKPNAPTPESRAWVQRLVDSLRQD